MPIQRSSNRMTVDEDARALLQMLIEAPPQPAPHMSPVTLRSIAAQRDQALRGFRRRTWVDDLLRRAEWLMSIAALAVFGFWMIDGPVRDWLREPTRAATWDAPTPNMTPQAAPATSAKQSLRAAALPFTRPDMLRDEPADTERRQDMPPAQSGADFIAPRQGVPAGPVADDARLTRLVIPTIDLDTPVKETFIVDGAWEVAEYAAGYMHGTGLPGQGNTALAGHAGLRGAVFRDLPKLAPGDDVYLDAGGWRYHYRVRGAASVWPTQVEVLDPTPTPVLTMMTCVNWDAQRLVVTADLVGSRPAPRS